MKITRNTKKYFDMLNNEIKYVLNNPDELVKLFDKYNHQFYPYSVRNMMLANCTCWSRFNKGMEQIASYHKWKSLGRQVRKGEKSIKILKPVIGKVFDYITGEEIGTKLYGFTTTNVFDISQTDGDDLNYDSNDFINVGNLTLDDVISKCVMYPISVDTDTEFTRGYTDGKTIHISSKNSNNQKICVAFHEMAHCYLNHIKDSRPTRVQELEAEAVSFIVSKHFGITNKVAKDYICNWNLGESDKVLSQNFNNIISCSNIIIDLIEKV